MSEITEGVAPIDLEAFARVTMRLREALLEHRKDPSNLFILDAVVKRFELTYELSIRTLRRFLIDGSLSSTEILDMTFAGIIRRGDKEGLLRTGWPGWQEFRKARNETVHTYREEKARAVAGEAEHFLPEAEHLLRELQKRMKRNG
jgi:nucleotidyltransferase substrate binding protein (TIGR01987 family)